MRAGLLIKMKMVKTSLCHPSIFAIFTIDLLIIGNEARGINMYKFKNQ
jgi:hypothetical protein